MYEEIVYEVEDPIATLTLNRPAVLNAWTDRMGAEVKHALAAAENDPRVVVILLTGAGRGFCSGADLKRLQAIGRGERGNGLPSELEADPGDPALEDFRGTYTFPMSIRKPVIAAINGPVAGMALPIALACDLRFASDRARFTASFSQRGLVAEWGVSWLLTRLVGPAHALDILMSSRKFDAEEAERIGIVNRVLPHDELLPFVRSYAHELATRCSPASLAIMKRQVYENLHHPHPRPCARPYAHELATRCSPASLAIMKRQVYENLHDRLGHAEKESVQLMLESFGRPDFREGVDAFLEKRAPKFERL